MRQREGPLLVASAAGRADLSAIRAMVLMLLAAMKII
jgi:hypothetical protein